MRILCVTTKLCTGGVQTFLVSYARELVKYDIWMDFVVQTKEEQLYDQELINIGCRIFSVCPYEESKYRFFKDIYKILQQNSEYEILHTHLNFLNAIPLFAAFLAKCPTRISHSHSNYLASSLKARIARVLLRLAIKIFATDLWACSQASANWLYGIRSNVQIVKNAVDNSKYTYNYAIREKLRTSLEIPDSHCVWIHVGTYSRIKNQIHILNVLKEYIACDNKVRLLLCGDGELSNEINNTINELGLQDHVIQIGYTCNVCDYLQAADVFVFPSLFEGLPFALIEAQTAGLPVVVSNAISEEALFGNYYKCETFNASEWVLNINNAKQLDRTHSVGYLQASGYSLDEESKRLAELYRTLI